MPAAPIAPQSPGSPPGRQRRTRLWLAAVAVSALAGYAANALFTRAPSPALVNVQPAINQGVPAIKVLPFTPPLSGTPKQPGCPQPSGSRSFSITFGSPFVGVPAASVFSARILAIPSPASASADGAALFSLMMKGGGGVVTEQCAIAPGSYRLVVVDSIDTTFDKLGIPTSTHLYCVSEPPVVTVTGAATPPVSLMCK